MYFALFVPCHILQKRRTVDPEDDAVRVIMGGDWRMPTLAEITELMDNCVAIGATLKGVEGVKMVSKKTSNWYAYAIGISSGYAYITSYYRIAGCNIRPVCN